ncbi:MAG: glycosyltransferase family 4 protein [Actinomycetota bacterium]
MTSVAIHVDQLFYRIPGGIGTYVRQLLPALRAADPGLDLSVFHSRFEGERPGELDGFRPIRLTRGIRTLYPLWNLAGRPPLPSPLVDRDVIHAPSPVAIPPVRGGQRLVVTVHDLAFRLYPEAYPPGWRLLHRAGFRRAIRSGAEIIAVSRSTAADVARLGGIHERSIRVVPLGGSIPVGTSDPAPVLQRLRVPKPYILFVGTLEARKNLVRLIRAYRRTAPRVPHTLVLAGPLGWRSQPILQELAAAGPGGIVTTGRVSESDLDALHRAADLFAYPSQYEGFGLPVLDAMARGVPVLTSNTSSLPELVGDAAVQVPPGSTGALATAMEQLLTDTDERSRLSAAGRDRAGEYSWERTARATLEVYERASES